LLLAADPRVLVRPSGTSQGDPGLGGPVWFARTYSGAFGLDEDARAWFAVAGDTPGSSMAEALNAKALPASTGMSGFSAGLGRAPDEA
jgi:hypothetical protein